MKEQVQRLNKTPGVETQAGVLQTGVTQTANMGYVQQKESKGSKLAKTLGMVTDTAMKGYELYQGQKDEEALSQFHTDKIQIIEELNGLNSDADRVLYMNDKIKRASSPDVNVKYRDALINSFGGKYDSYLKGAKVEGYKAQENEFFKRIATGLNDPDFTYEGLVSEFGPRVRKENLHSIYASALIQNAQLDSADIKTKEDLDMFKAKYKEQFKTYNANPYAGGSKSKEAVDIQIKVKKGFDLLVEEKTKVFKEDYQVKKATIERDLSMSPDLYNKLINSSEYQDKSDAIKAEVEYKKSYDKKQRLDTFDYEYKVDSPTNNANYEMLNADEKKIVKEKVNKNITFGLESGAYSSLVNTVANNTKASDAILKGFFNTNTTSSDMINKQLTAFNALKNTRDGDIVLYGINKNDRVALEILSVYPEADSQMIREVLNSDMIKDGQYGEKNKYYNDWQKVVAKLSPKDREVANSLRQYAYNTNGRDAQDSIDFVKDNFVPSVSKDIDSVQFLGRVEETKAEQLKTTIDLVYTGFDYDTVEVLDDGRIRVFNSDMPFVSSTVTEKDLNDAQSALLKTEQLKKKLDEINIPENVITEGMGPDFITDVKEGIVELYKNNSDIIGALEEGETPSVDFITNFKDEVKAWSNRVNGTDFKLSTDSDSNESTIQIDNVVDSILDFIGPTKAQGSELQLNTEGESRIKSLFNNVDTVDDTTPTNTGIADENFLAEEYNAASKAEQQGWLRNSNRPVETPAMQKNLASVQSIVENTKAYDSTLKKYNINKEELKQAIKKAYSAETHYGTFKSKVSDTGALGEMQLLLSTARDLTKSGKQYFGKKAAKEAGINLSKFDKDEAYAKDVLINNKKANVLFAIAKMLSAYKSTKIKE